MKYLPVLSRGLAYEVGNGIHIKFWEDVWCSERLLKEEFPYIYAMVEDPNSIMASYMTIQGEEVVWVPRLRRADFDWEIPRLIELFNWLQDVQVSVSGVDQ